MSALIFGMCGSVANDKSNADATTGQEDAAGWDITVKGKVTFPQKGKILLTELRPDREGKKDSLMLNKDNSFEKKVHLTEAGYYSFNFYNKQMINVILYKMT